MPGRVLTPLRYFFQKRTFYDRSVAGVIGCSGQVKGRVTNHARNYQSFKRRQAHLRKNALCPLGGGGHLRGRRFLDEAAAESGSAHFIEHMLFKRTMEPSAAELAFEMDAIGGQINAYTTRESTCFYARVLDTHLTTAIALLSEMFFDCAFDEAEAESERGVILEEIGMYEDTPDDCCYERLMSGCYKGALGRPVLGKPATLSTMTGASLRKFKESHYTAGNIIVSCAEISTRATLNKSRRALRRWQKPRRPKSASPIQPCHHRAQEETEQNQFCVAFPSSPSASEERFALNLMTTILGGGVSSRLFQNIREKYGLCYSVYAFQSGFADTGMLSVATAVGKDTELKTLGLIGDELKKFVDDGVTEEEFSRAREQAKSSLVISLESTNSRMLKMGNSMQILGPGLTADELIANMTPSQARMF